MSHLDENTARELVKIGEEKIDHFQVAGNPFVLAPQELKLHDFDHLLPVPRNIKANPVFTAVDSFLEYYNEYSSERSCIFVDVQQKMPEVVAIFDYHGPNSPDNCLHRATLKLKLSEEWKAWRERNDKFHGDQESFAHFVEDNAACFISPDSAEMMEIALTITATIGVDFESSKRMNNGTHSIKYHEEVKANAGGAGNLEIPENISVALKVFDGVKDLEADEEGNRKTVRYQIDGKFRYKIRDGSLHLKYKLIGMDVVFDHAVDHLTKYIDGAVERGMVLEGSPQ